METSSASSRGPGALAFRLKTPTAQIVSIAGFLLLMGAATLISYRQRASRQFEPDRAIGSPQWWLKPIEQNTVLLPAVLSDYPESVSFITPRVGWAVGDVGPILHTEDGGENWKAQARPTQLPLFSVTVFSARSGWVVGFGGTILHTEDGGKSWKPQASGIQLPLTSVAFVSAQSGWAVGVVGTILHTEDGGSNWKAQHSGTKQNLSSVAFVSPESGWAVGDYGTILYTEDGGNSWKTQASGAQQSLYSVAFVSARSGWAVGDWGPILHTEDGGKSWKPQASDMHLLLRSVTFVSPQSGWAVGDGGTIVHTEDGGQTWRRQGYRRWPAPWFWVALVFCSSGLAWALLPLGLPATEFIEDLANADSPVSHLKYDSLGYRPLVMRLLHFIQNPKTKPPLVLAIQAPWGMGKSSVMAMLETELKWKKAAVTVWFNAWHHQKEDQLLAYLLEAVQMQVAPSWLSAVGLKFRFNLLRVRMFSSAGSLLATTAALALLVFHRSVTAWVASLKPEANFLQQHPALPGVLLATLLLANQLRAFASDPQKLLEQSARTAWSILRDLLIFPSLQGKTDVRQEFAKNLREVTDALLPQRLVIFLDDLDRCRPEQVVQIMEAINFLSSAAPCFIVVGADYKKVETLVGQHFEPVAIQEAENAVLVNPTISEKEKKTLAIEARVNYARVYMRKIVNMRLDLPKPRPKGYADLIRQAGEAGSAGRILLQQASVGLLLILCLGASVSLAVGWWQPPFGEKKSTAASARPLPPAGEAIGETVRTASEEGPTAAKARVENPAPAAFADIDRNAVGVLWNHRLTVAVPALIAVFFLILFFSRPKELEKAVDSKTFSEALDKMAPAIQERCGTPREVRRFQNYLRFLAAWDDSATRPKAEGLEAGLVELAATGIRTAEGDVRSDIARSVIEFFSQQCEMLGLDPDTFQPIDEIYPKMRDAMEL